MKIFVVGSIRTKQRQFTGIFILWIDIECLPALRAFNYDGLAWDLVLMWNKTAKQVGQQVEGRVRDYLVAQGLSFVQANYLCKMGEIDLIMKERDTLVFIEVRYRKSSTFGSAVESVTYQKQQKLIKAAQHYLTQYRIPDHYCRFDVVGLTGVGRDEKVEWIQDAFQAL